MKAILCIALIALCAAPALANVDITFAQFQDWVKYYGKTYDGPEEYMARYQTYKDNVAKVNKLNAEGNGTVYAINKFADLSASEFKAQYLGYTPRFRGNKQRQFAHFSKPKIDIVAANVTQFDWRSKGAVTPVKDQQQCGSCWAFSATEAIESAMFMAGKSLPILSPQQIVSCDTTDGGCNGGDTITAYQYVEKAGGLETEAAYPYTSGNGNSGVCHFDKSKIAASISGFKYATPPCTDSCAHQDEATMASNLVSMGPLSICVYAETWQFYSGGVLKTNCPKSYNDLDHCVQAVGFNLAASPNYWIVRNSWNTDWGIQGYIYIEYGINLCGVADEATMPYA